METTEAGKTVAEFQKNKSEKVKAILKEWRGLRLLDLRVFHMDEHGMERPTAKGLCLRVEALPDLRRAVEALEAASKPEAAKE